MERDLDVDPAVGSMSDDADRDHLRAPQVVRQSKRLRIR
jgi:hypothetical protein